MINFWVDNVIYFSISYLLAGSIIALVNRYDMPRRMELHNEFLRMSPYQLDYYLQDPCCYAKEIQAIQTKIDNIKADVRQYDRLYKTKHACTFNQFKQSLLWPAQLAKEISALFKHPVRIHPLQPTTTPYPMKAEVIALERYVRYEQRQKPLPTALPAARRKHRSL
jgi:hypothetical protein